MHHPHHHHHHHIHHHGHPNQPIGIVNSSPNVIHQQQMHVNPIVQHNSSNSSNNANQNSSNNNNNNNNSNNNNFQHLFHQQFNINQSNQNNLMSTSPITTPQTNSNNSSATNSTQSLTAVNATNNPLQELLSLFECPVCFEYALPPILQCQSGHIVCSNCRPKLTCCPSCRSPLGNIRNLSMEKLANSLQFPCKYLVNGCMESLLHDKKYEHEDQCGIFLNLF